MATKVTFTVDDATIGRLQEASSRLAISKSEVVREAIQEFYERIGRLSERERLSMLRTLDAFFAHRPPGGSRAVDRELKELREARRSGGRGHRRKP